MSDSECEDHDYKAQRNAEMKRTYEKNCDLLFATIYKTVKAQKDQTEKFYIGPVDFTNGEEDFNLDTLYNDLTSRSDIAEVKSIKAVAYSPKAVPFVPIRDISITLHSYDISNVYVFTNNNEMENFIKQKYNRDNVDVIDGFANPMAERDNTHKYAFEYYLSRNVIKRSDSEEMIFGDELL
jgi:hypothetical protein